LHIRVFVSARQEASTQIQSWPGLHWGQRGSL